eukprot:5454735-Amphidinium_carterae.1
MKALQPGSAGTSRGWTQCYSQAPHNASTSQLQVYLRKHPKDNCPHPLHNTNQVAGAANPDLLPVLGGGGGGCKSSRHTLDDTTCLTFSAMSSC